MCKIVCEEQSMVTSPSVQSYQPAVALQGEPQRNNNTVRQEPKENQVQPKQAAAADSQSSDKTSSKRTTQSVSTTETTERAPTEDRGNQLDITV